MGLRDIERKIRTKSAYQRKEAEILLEELDQMIENATILKEQLKKFEKKHAKEIKTNKEYYSKISSLREQLGLPKEVGVYEWKDSPSIGDKISGKGYYDELANEILELGKSESRKTGGIISIAELVIKLNKIRPGKIVPARDVIRALETLTSINLIPPIRTLPSGVKIVEFVSVELSNDQEILLDLASKHGYLTQEAILIQLGWPTERINRVLDELIKQGIAIKDETYEEGIKYWFPSMG